MSQPLIDVKQVTKSYRLWSKPADRLTATLFEQVAEASVVPRSWRDRVRHAADRRGTRFVALHDTSFTLAKGESLGVIGRNGSGKSTLLQILARTLQPSSGEVQVNGRTAALLELGSGFNLEFSGRENVLLQAALYGFSKREITARMAEVEEFAGIGEFIEQPAKVYSSGMLVRLAFATQTILAPDLFIVDEALAVGDVFFQAKCARFFQERLAQGMSLILVSHDLVSVKALCAKAIVLHEGHVVFSGPSPDAISFYHQLHRGSLGAAQSPVQLVDRSQSNGAQVALPAGARERNWEGTQEVGSREAELVYCSLKDAKGTDRAVFDLGERVTLELFARSKAQLDRVLIGFEIANRHNQVAFGVTSVHLGQGFCKLEAAALYRYAFAFEARLGAGDYVIDAALGWGDRGDGAPEQLLHRVSGIARLSVRHLGNRPSFFGLGDLHACFESK